MKLNPKYFTALAVLLCFPVKSFSAASSNIMIDQFGYRTTDTKVAVFAQPVSGYNAPSSFTPGATFYVINASGGTTVYAGSISVWNSGNADTGQNSSSGDKGWWGDFSTFTTPGTYYISVPGGSNPGSQSYNFTISDTIYNPVLQAATRMYLYQRCGENITAALGGSWNHAACHQQEETATLYDNSKGGDQGAGTARDVRGGWHDAGDYNKYVPFTSTVIWDLLHAYEWNPCAFGDNSNIPESGNGVPDILDEVKWELDWIQRMQITNAADPNYGACYSVVGELSSGPNPVVSPPDNDTSTKNYTDLSSYATSTLAMDFADAARLFAAYNTQYPGYSAQLQNSAIAAWNWLQAHSAPVSYDNTNFSQANANGDSYQDFRLRVAAAAELFRLTGNTAYQTYFDANYNNPSGFDNGGTYSVINQGFWATNSGELERAMVDYCLTTGATPSVVTAIKNALVTGLTDNQIGSEGSDLYRAYMWSYYWGSNQGKATWGNQLLWAVKLNASPANNAAYLAKAEDYLHYFHGVNPNDLVYLTNTGLRGVNIGASNPIMSIYHSWFQAGTTYDGNTGPSALGPAPGYLSGGPNPYYAPDASYGSTISPPQNEPPQKSYKDWGANWPQDSWEVTEPGIYYQAAYLFLCSSFATCGGPTPTFTPTATGTQPTATRTPTLTPTFTVTVSPTPTATQCVVLFNGCESLTQNGTWSGTNSTQSLSTTDVTQGTYSLQAAVTNNPAGGWNDQVLDLSGFTPTNWSNVTQLVMDIDVPAGILGSTYSQLFLYADSAPTTYEQALASNSVNLTAGENLNVTFNLSLTGAFTPGSPITKLYFIYNSNAPTGAGTYGSFYVDNIRLINSCAAIPTPTPTATRTMTPTFTATPSPTVTLTATSTLTPTPTVTVTHTFTVTPTSTATITFSATTTPTITLTPLYSYTPTLTPTITATPTVTGTFTPTPSPTKTASATPTDSTTPTSSSTLTAAPSASPTQTPTITWTPVFSFTPTSTPTNTKTSTSTDSMTPSATASRTPTATYTSTGTASLTATPSASPTKTATATPSFTPVPTPTSQATVTLSLNASPNPVLPGQSYSYSLQVTVAGGPSNNTVLTLNLPSSVTVSAFTQGPAGTVSGSQITWNLGTMPVGTTTFGVQVTVADSASGPLAGQASLTDTGGTFSSNSSQVSIISPTPILTFTPTPSPPPVAVIFPNPATGPGPVSIAMPDYPGSAPVTVKVYTTAFRWVNKAVYPDQAGGTDIALPLVDRWDVPLANGLYYVVVFTPQGRAIDKLLVIR